MKQYIIIYRTKSFTLRRAEYLILNDFQMYVIRAGLNNAGYEIVNEQINAIDLPLLISDTRISQYAQNIMDVDGDDTFQRVM